MLVKYKFFPNHANKRKSCFFVDWIVDRTSGAVYLEPRCVKIDVDDEENFENSYIVVSSV